MNGSCEIPDAQLCGCCQGVGRETPEPITNRPGLSSIAYRVGTQPTFKASLLAALSNSALPALASLRTRDDSDFSIALLDAWATTLDILTFYQERIANEFYLRTAVDGFSVVALARLVGYQPSPGVAASAFLAFTISSAPGSPDNVPIPAGTRVQSIPGPGQQPQVFETSSDLTAVIAQNAISPQTTLPWELNAGDSSIWLQGTANNINAGDALLFVSAQLQSGASSGSTTASGAAEVHFVTSATPDSNSGNTLVAWDQPLKWTTAHDTTASVYVFRKKAALFGVQAPDPRTLSSTGNNLSSLAGWPAGGNGDWNFAQSYVASSFQINLDASYPGATPVKGGAPGWMVLTSPDYIALYQVTAATDTGPVRYTLATKTTQVTLANGQVLVNNVSTAANIAKLETAYAVAFAQFILDLELGVNPSGDFEIWVQILEELIVALGPVDVNEVLSDFVAQTRNTTAFVQSSLLAPADPPYVTWSYGITYQQQTGVLKPVEGTLLELAGGTGLVAGQPVAVSGKRLRLQVSTGSQALDASAGFVPDGALTATPLTAGQTFLVDAFPPTDATTGTDQLWTVITTDGVAGMLTIAAANVLLVPADKGDAVVGESNIVSNVVQSGPIVTLSFEQQLTRLYDRSTVSVNANVIGATQGETMYEILGSGDGTNAALQFTLKQSPLTYVPSSLGMGAASTLQVWVNNMQWHEVGNFLDSGPSDRVFITETGASQKVTVQFGDGQEGERTPTGQMNIRAVYRKGIGSAGNVLSGQLSQALDRPQGLKSVINPDPASGGADPATPDDARASAPLHVLTLGRVVSLEDYQNYALAFAGIAKALATWTWSGRTRSIFLTVAGANGLVYQPDDNTITKLKTALWNSGNPHVPLQVMSYSKVLFEVGASVLIDQTDYDPTVVLQAVWQMLSTAFSFDQRQIGQGVAQSEVIALIQQTPGVIAVELTGFSRQGQAQTQPLPAVLQAASPTPGEDGTPQPAEMLLLDPASQANIGVWS